jgi:hypothetical protein
MSLYVPVLLSFQAKSRKCRCPSFEQPSCPLIWVKAICSLCGSFNQGHAAGLSRVHSFAAFDLLAFEWQVDQFKRREASINDYEALSNHTLLSASINFLVSEADVQRAGKKFGGSMKTSRPS